MVGLALIITGALMGVAGEYIEAKERTERTIERYEKSHNVELPRDYNVLRDSNTGELYGGKYTPHHTKHKKR